MRVMHSLGTWSSRSTQPHRAKFNEDCQLGWKRKAKRHASARQRSALVIRAFVPQHGGKRLDTFPRELEYSAVFPFLFFETSRASHLLPWTIIIARDWGQPYSNINSAKVIMCHVWKP